MAMLRPWRKGVTQIAATVGRSKCHISEVLAGHRKPGRELAAALRKLGVRIGRAK